jgi:hypothetical protein
MLAVKLKELRKELLCNLDERFAKKFATFAESQIHGLGTEKAPRYSVKRIEEAIEFCCRYPKAVAVYKTISEARKALGQD